MKKFYPAIAAIFLLTMSAISTFAQTQTPTVSIAFIDTGAFYDEKAGIIRLMNANKRLESDFAARIKELQDGSTKLQSIAAELDRMQKLPQAQFDQTAYQKKQEEGEQLQGDLNKKKSDYEAEFNKRQKEMITPISTDIGKAMDEFAKRNGYTVVLDIGKFANAGAVLYFGQAADATKAFIDFYNARAVATP